jgi:pimeloyl-ACP methyl ester carboxylesterase
LFIWGNQDPVIGRAGVDLTPQYMKGEYSLLELDAGHALVQEKVEPVKQAILDHIQTHPIKG